MFDIITYTHARSRRGKNVRKGHFVPRAAGRGAGRVPARAAAAALVAAGVSVSGVMCGGAAASAATRPASHPGVPPLYARTFTVTRLTNAGPGSLRAAITRANLSLPGRPTLIRFAVRGTITLSSPLPAVSRNVTINGASAPGYALGGPPVVEIDANGQAGLEFARGSSGAQLLGLAVDDAGGDGITLEASNITLDRNYIGLNLSGASFGNHGDGVFVAASSWGNTIGENPAGKSGAVSNVISGNAGNGITLSGSSVNTVAANRIGTNAAGTSAIPNRHNGLAIIGRSYANEVGGTVFVDSATGTANNPTGSKGTVTPVFVVPPDGNLISGNGRNGVLIDDGAGHNELNGNFVGTTASGDAALGNGANGVWIDGANHNSLVGCKFVNNPFVYYNVVSGNKQDGLRVTNANDTVVQGNFFGTGANNTAIVKNALDGILVGGSSAGTQVGGVIPLGNVSAGNGLNGIKVSGTASGFTTFNTFGGLLAFKGAAPNGRDGLLITATGGSNTVRTNVFSGNRGNGIELAGNASGVTVDPNIAGLTTNGGSPLPNGGDGLLIDGTAHNNVIGGSTRSVIPQNTFSGNDGYGVAITAGAHNNQVFGSFIGTEILGVSALGNHLGGVLLSGNASANAIGAVNLTPANLISGNDGTGVLLQAGTTRNLVINNYIGLGRRGRRLPNTGRPIVNDGSQNTIRGNRT
ncbi:MAG: beta strand repeat-containing protein [Streptosporangiaceae bacterium]